jgi:secreted trypsin-like serine protease
MTTMLWLFLCWHALIAQALTLQRDLIINGTITPQQRYPYTVYLQDKDFLFCGGSLIAEDVVMTAAHCIPDDIRDITVVEGEHNLTDNVLGDVVKIKENVIHPLYMNSENDKTLILR